MVIFDLKLTNTSKIKVLFSIPYAELFFEANVSRDRFEEFGLIILCGANVHIRIDTHG